jgi:hypothetical protein
MLDKVKLAMAITTDAYDAELSDLIDAAKLDLGIAGVNSEFIHDKLIQRAIITYCRMMFHSPADFENLRWAYESLKGSMAISTGYTEWGALNGNSGCPYANC